MAISLKNKIVFITGASSGMGYACAEHFAKKGAKLIIAARRFDRLVQLAQTLELNYNTHVLPLALDVSNHSAVSQAIENLENEWKNIDILINNAGISLSSDKLQDTAIEKWDAMIKTNVNGLLYVTKAILPTMLVKNSGHIINIGSLTAHYVFAGSNIYAATKHAVKAITQALRVDLLGTNIRVSQIDPGATETEFSFIRWGDENKAKAFYKKMKALEAADIAQAIIFCATRNRKINIDSLIINNIDMAGTYHAHADKENHSTIFD